MTDVAKRIDEVIAIEGGYVDHPSDRGGPTRYGITQATARVYGYTGSMKALPIATARAIYLRQYWTAPRFDLVDPIASKVAAELLDTGINMGPGTAVRFLQRALNVFQGAGLAIDGVITFRGATLATLGAYMARRAAQQGEGVLVELMNGFQGERYAAIVEGDASQRDFVFGQVRNRVMLRAA